MFGLILGGLLGGLLSKPKKQPVPPPPPPAPPPQVVVVEKQTNTVDMAKMVEDSKKAGFNPLTVMRNGGLAGYQVTSVPFLTTNPAFVDWEAKNKWEIDKSEIETRNSNAQRQWLGGLVSNLGGMFDTVTEKYNPTTIRNAEQRRVLENDLLRSEIARNNSSVPKMFQPTVAYPKTSRVTTVSGASIFGDANPAKWGYEVETPKITNPAPSWWERTNIFGNMSNWEDAYAEAVSLPLGIVSLSVDSAYNAYRGARWSLGRGRDFLLDNEYVRVSPTKEANGISIKWGEKPANSGGAW